MQHQPLVRPSPRFGSIAAYAGSKLCALGLLVLALPACRSRPLPPPASSDFAQTALAARLCTAVQSLPAERKAACCAKQQPSDFFEHCVRSLDTALRRRAVTLDAQRVEACENAARTALDGCDWVTPGQPLAPAACIGVVRGELARGSACSSSLECSANLHCQGETPTKPGVCAPPLENGAGCGVESDTLASLVADRGFERAHPICADFCSLVTHKCEPAPRVGAPCFASENCANGQVCSAGKCSERSAAALGEACALTPCATGLRCDEGRCLALAAPGEACRSDFDCALGGCNSRPDGRATCGAECTLSFAALKSARRMRLPSRPLANSAAASRIERE